jgi:hypothetical protein
MVPHSRSQSHSLSHAHARFRPEALERRTLMAAAPSVEAVYVADTEWAVAFRTFLEDTRDGSAQFGFEAGTGGGTKAILPWIHLDQVSIQFSEDVIVQQDDLDITGASGAAYAVSDFDYDPATFTATWTLAAPIEADVLTLRLDGTSAAGVTDAEGNLLRGNQGGKGGGDFVQELSVLPGDNDRSGDVSLADAERAGDRFFSSVFDIRADNALPKYTIFYDLDGSGFILAEDRGAVVQRIGSTLP